MPDTDRVRGNDPVPSAAGPEERGRVVAFRPRNSGPRPSSHQPSSPESSWREPASPVEDIGKFARGDRDDDYRHRMLLNVAALVFVVFLAACGVWIANTMAQIRNNEDCVLSGRRNCNPIDLPALKR